MQSIRIHIRLHVLQVCHVGTLLYLIYFSSEHTNVTKCWGVLKPYRESWHELGVISKIQQIQPYSMYYTEVSLRIRLHALPFCIALQ